MLSILSNCMVIITVLVNCVSCAYTQARKTETGSADSKPAVAQGENPANQKSDNMNDIFKISETVEKTFPVSSKTVVKVYSFEGEINVKSGSAGSVSLQATKMAVDKDAAEAVKYTFSQQNGTLNLQADFTKPDRKVNYGKNIFYTKGAYVNWELVLPAETDLILETEEGKIVVQNVSGEIKLSTKDGGITVKDCRGKLDLETFDGNVRVSGYRGIANIVNRGDEPVVVEGDFQNLSVETGGGDVFLGLPKSGGGTIEAAADNVSVKDFVLNRTGQNGDGWNKYTFGSGNSNIKVQPNTGKLSIYPF